MQHGGLPWVCVQVDMYTGMSEGLEANPGVSLQDLCIVSLRHRLSLETALCWLFSELQCSSCLYVTDNTGHVPPGLAFYMGRL